MLISEIIQEIAIKPSNLRLEPSDLTLARPAIATPKDIADSTIQQIQFIGPKAANFDQSRLKTAKKLLSMGYTDDEVWEKTGTFQGPDGQWRQEVADGPAVGVTYAQLGLNDVNKKLTLADIMDHPELFKAYPGLRNMKFTVTNTGNAYGTFNPYTGEIELSKELLDDPVEFIKTIHHEVQHAIQAIENWQGGGNPDSDTSMDVADTELFKTWAEYTAGNYKNMDRNTMAKYLVYKSYGGEASAREVEDRIMGLYDFGVSDREYQEYLDLVKPQIGKDMPYLTYDTKDVPDKGGITTGDQSTIDSPEFNRDFNYHDTHDTDGNKLNFGSINNQMKRPNATSPKPKLRPKDV